MKPLDAELVSAVSAGDEGAIAELYDRHADGVFRVAFRLLGDRHLAEDVLQETYLALWNRSELFNPVMGSLKTWLFTIARNRAVDRLRAQGRHPLPIPLSAILMGEESGDDRLACQASSGGVYSAGATSSHGSDDPVVAVEAAWLRQAVRSALDAVPETERRAIELAYYEELSQSEIAARLGWPLGTVKTRTRRAFGRLRSLLQELVGVELGLQLTPSAPAQGADPDGTLAEPVAHAPVERGIGLASETGGERGPR